jgi:hypothetical protein
MAKATTGPQRFDGAIVATGPSVARKVVSTVIIGRGVFNGVARIVEVDNGPDDPDDVLRDDLVFPAGTLHLLSTNVDAQFSVDAATRTFTGVFRQTSTSDGGTGVFAHVQLTANATVTAHGLGRRNADGSCSEDQAPLFEVDVISARGTISL